MTKRPQEFDPRWSSQVTDELLEAVRSKATDGKATCPMLRKLAEDMGVPNQVVGAAAEMAGVKVHNCDLGCF